MLARIVWGTESESESESLTCSKFKWVFAFVKEGVKACQDALWHLCSVKTVV